MSTATHFERVRLLDAMLEELMEKGYPQAEVESAIRRAHLDGNGWSRRFLDKDACLCAAFDQFAERLRAAARRGCATAGSWPQRVGRGLRELLAELARNPELAHALAQDFPAIGPAAQRRYQELVESFAPSLAAGRRLAEDTTELPEELEILAVGAAEAIVFEAIEAGRAEELPALGPAILFSLLVPFLGPAAAIAAMELAQPGQLEVA